PAGAFVFDSTGAASAHRHGKGCPVRPGSKNSASAHEDPPGTWDALILSTRGFRQGDTGDQPQARSRAFWAARAKRQTQRVVSPSEAQRSAARGRQGIAHLHSTGEAGEPGPRGPWGGKGDVRHGLVSGTPAEDSA